MHALQIIGFGVTEAMRIDNPVTGNVLDVTEVREIEDKVWIAGRTNSGRTETFTIDGDIVLTRWVQ